MAAFDDRVFDPTVTDELATGLLAKDPESETIRLPMLGGAFQ